MIIQDYTVFDVYVGKWLLDITYLVDADRQQTRYNVFWHGDTCFVDVMPPDGGSVSCMTKGGAGINLSTWSDGVNRWSGEGRMHVAGLVGISSHFSFWMPGLLIAPDSVPFSDAELVANRHEYEATTAPRSGKRYVGLVEDGLLIGLKYHVAELCYVQANLEFQRLTKFAEK